VFACQVHATIARQVLGASDVANAFYSDDKKVGAYMKDRVFKPGATLSWNALTKHATGEDLNAKAFAAEFGAK
jgi:peptidyl-dipeptidase A